MTLPDPVDSIVQRLTDVPGDASVAIVMRHAEREEIPPGDFGVDVPLTERGIAEAKRMGSLLSARGVVCVTSSPVPRCVETAEAVLRGADSAGEATLDRRLGDPGPFVVDPAVAGALFLETDILDVVRRQLSGGKPPAGMRETSEGVNLLLDSANDAMRSGSRLNILVTHDAILAVLVSHLYGVQIDEIVWPGYLDGLVLWQDGDILRFAWRGLEQSSHPVRC